MGNKDWKKRNKGREKELVKEGEIKREKAKQSESERVREIRREREKMREIYTEEGDSRRIKDDDIWDGKWGWNLQTIYESYVLVIDIQRYLFHKSKYSLISPIHRKFPKFQIKISEKFLENPRKKVQKMKKFDKKSTRFQSQSGSFSDHASHPKKSVKINEFFDTLKLNKFV